MAYDFNQSPLFPVPRYEDAPPVRKPRIGRFFNGGRASDSAQTAQAGSNLAWFICLEAATKHTNRVLKGELPMRGICINSLGDEQTESGFPECCGQVMRMLGIEEHDREPYKSEIERRARQANAAPAPEEET